MANSGLIKSYIAAAVIAPFRICKPAATAGQVQQAAAATDKQFGVTTIVGAKAIGDTVDLVHTGLADVEYGGNVAAGDLLTADADGKAVVAAPAGGANARIIGVAHIAGASGDIGRMFITPGSMQGAA